MRKIKIYTDGSCLGNPGFGGWGVIILDGEKEIILSGGQENTTNNRMELTAIIESLRWIKSYCIDTEVQIFSDSNLYISSITKNWKRKKNLDLWEEFDRLYRGLSIEWSWVKGHSTNRYNNKVDKIALKEAEKMKYGR